MFSDRYEELRKRVEEELTAWVPAVDHHSGILDEAMKYSLEAGGKRLRPVLLLESCVIAGGEIEEAMAFACAMEFIHTYSLIHDDHPSMDNDDLRRGKPTNHKVFGDDMAILAGDGLLNCAFDVMIRAVMDAADDPAKMQRRLRAMQEISDAAGVHGMIAGQVADCRPEIVPGDEEEKLLYIHRNKTGAIIRASVRAGAILGGADEETLKAFTEYAEQVGLTFQIVDDILDVIGSIRELGKNVGMDQQMGKLTYPSVYGLEYSYDRAREVTEQAVEALSGIEGTAFLKELALDLLNRIS